MDSIVVIPHNFSGSTFGRWTVLEFDHFKMAGKVRNIYWLCRCECGTTRPVVEGSLKRGLSKSCGCLKTDEKVAGRLDKSGERTGTYYSWDNMIGRCYRESQPDYEEYGGRGITVCDRWKNSFVDFLDDMGPRPSGTTLDRIESDGNYEPGNCRWATVTVQQRNKRNSVRVIYRGAEMHIMEASEQSGIPMTTLRSRLNAGDTGERLFRPLR